METMKKTINFFIVNMAMSDLLFSVFAFPWALTEYNAGSWLISGTLGTSTQAVDDINHFSYKKFFFIACNCTSDICEDVPIYRVQLGE